MLPSLRRLSATPATRVLRVLGLESSADDACAAVVTSQRQILSSVVCKQHDINAKYGGIHPIKAQDAHSRDMPAAIRRALAEAKVTMADIDAVAYTRGPGIYGCLSIGATGAKAIAAATGKPAWGIHHMQAHTLTPFLTEDTPPTFPFLTLLVSGGHTMLVLVKSVSDFRIITTKLDNSVGDAFDKTARLLQLPHSPTLGLGAQLEHYASQPPLPPYDQKPLPPIRRPLSTNKAVRQLAFSFAGLMSSTEKVLKTQQSNIKLKIPESIQREMSRLFQTSAIGHMVQKVGMAIELLRDEEGIKESDWGGLIVSGGVASNQYLKDELRKMLDRRNAGKGMKLYYPPLEFCTDNAAMIAWTAIMRMQTEGEAGDPDSLPIRPKWSLEDLYNDVPQHK